MRKAEVSRKTGETDIRVSLTLEGTGKSSTDTGIGFLDHMLTLFAPAPILFTLSAWSSISISRDMAGA